MEDSSDKSQVTSCEYRIRLVFSRHSQVIEQESAERNPESYLMRQIILTAVIS